MRWRALLRFGLVLALVGATLQAAAGLPHGHASEGAGFEAPCAMCAAAAQLELDRTPEAALAQDAQTLPNRLPAPAPAPPAVAQDAPSARAPPSFH